jgi:acetyl esterase/lipase
MASDNTELTLCGQIRELFESLPHDAWITHRPNMKIKLRPDNEIQVQKVRLGRVPTLILRPAERTPIPVAVLWIHGGGYVAGMKEMVYMSRAAEIVKHFGVTVISPGYRLAWQKPYPAAVNDCYSVLSYMDKNRIQLGFDRIMVGGESAGGGLCAAVCMMARDRGIHIAFQMPLYPMISNIDTESSKDNHGRIWNTRRNHIGWRMYLRKHAKEMVSPYAAASRQTDYSGLPPCYTFVGDGEPFYSETLRYAVDLKNAGVDAVVDVYHTDMHAFDMLNPDKEPGITAIKRFEERFQYALEHYR